MRAHVSPIVINRALAAAGRSLAKREQQKENLLARLLELFRGSAPMTALDGTDAKMAVPKLVECAVEIVLRSGILLERDTQEERDRMLMHVGADLEYLFLSETEAQFRTRYAVRCHWA
jgi:hypothetical protein